MKPILKEKAIKLRKQGLTYSEILQQITVSKSTLSLWLHSVGLSKKQFQKLTEKKLASMKRGAIAKHNQRIQLTDEIKKKSRAEIKSISHKELLLIGAALYWAEGSKEKEHSIGQGVIFSNSDPLMIQLFLKWLKEILNISREEIVAEIYIHENSINNINAVKKYWSRITDIPLPEFNHIYFKRNKLSTNRKNIGKNYYGLLRIRVRRSANMNRKISGWIEGILQNCGIVQW
ncbi:MAG: hypothetical protein AAB757_03185 [Patescibacteria group bacterium]